jgi:hypothetical protein
MSFWKRLKRMFGDDPTQTRSEGVAHTDEMAAAAMQHRGDGVAGDPFPPAGGAPPNWVPPADEGRPRH